MKEDAGEDMRVEPVEGAPISLKKVVEHINKTKPADKPDGIYVLVNNLSNGFVNDDANMANITIEEREIQANYFLSLNLPLPPYLEKYLIYMYEDDKPDIKAMYKYASTNPELKQLIGLIQLFGGSLKMAKDMKKSVRLFVEEPESRMHPKRERRIMSLLEKLKTDYGVTGTIEKKKKK
jgi:hypothetical protein